MLVVVGGVGSQASAVGNVDTFVVFQNNDPRGITNNPLSEVDLGSTGNEIVLDAF